MKRIACLFPAGSSPHLIVAALLVVGAVATAPDAAASKRPQRGGTLRVEMSERLGTPDPRGWPAVAALAQAPERVQALIYDRLIKRDERGNLQPALAVSWQHDEQSKRWQFRLRQGVKFSDGALLTPPVAAIALQQLLGSPYNVSATSDSVVIQTERSLPNLPEKLAAGYYFIYHLAEDSSLAGTGPFRVADWPDERSSGPAVLTANESCWQGRPFVDKIELLMGADFAQQANAISFDQADVVELPASEVRRAAQRGVRTASSDPFELFSLVFDASRPAVRDIRLRQAISLAIDRPSIADVILQKQAVSAGSLLPNWISGYAHLFPVAADLPRARDLLAASGHERSRSVPLVLLYDSGDAEAHAVADRVAVNLREVGIVVQVTGQMADGESKAQAPDIRLVRRRLAAPDAAAALSDLLNSLGEPAPTPPLETLEQVYAAESASISAFRVIPLVHVSESYGLGPQVRDWLAPRWGGWDLADVWLGPPAPSGGKTP